MQILIDKDAARALQLAQGRLRASEHASPPDAHLTASLYAVEAQAFSILELGDDAKNAASKGLEIATAAGDPVRLDSGGVIHRDAQSTEYGTARRSVCQSTGFCAAKYCT